MAMRSRLRQRKRRWVPSDTKCLHCFEWHSDDRALDMWLEHPIDDYWTAALRLGVQDGRPVITELRVFPTEEDDRRAGEWSAEVHGFQATVPEGGLTTTELRRVTLDQYLREALPELVQHLISVDKELHVGPLPEGVTPPFEAPGLRSATARGPRRRAAGRTDTEIAQIAADYVDAYANPRGSATRAVAARWGISEPAVREAVRAARDRGLLTPTTQGRGGGALTPAAVELLRTERHKQRRRAGDEEDR